MTLKIEAGKFYRTRDGRKVWPGYQLGQAMKKAQEAGGMIQRGQPYLAKAELLGAINYLAACVLMIEEAEK